MSALAEERPEVEKRRMIYKGGGRMNKMGRGPAMYTRVYWVEKKEE